jgi:hypothetical protein
LTQSGAGGYTLTISPNAASLRTLSGKCNHIKLCIDKNYNGADKITIDGSYNNSGKIKNNE